MTIITTYRRIELDNGAIIEVPEQTGLPELSRTDSFDDRLKRIEDRLATLLTRVPRIL